MVTVIGHSVVTVTGRLVVTVIGHSVVTVTGRSVVSDGYWSFSGVAVTVVRW